MLPNRFRRQTADPHREGFKAKLCENPQYIDLNRYPYHFEVCSRCVLPLYSRDMGPEYWHSLQLASRYEEPMSTKAPSPSKKPTMVPADDSGSTSHEHHHEAASMVAKGRGLVKGSSQSRAAPSPAFVWSVRISGDLRLHASGFSFGCNFRHIDLGTSPRCVSGRSWHGFP